MVRSYTFDEKDKFSKKGVKIVSEYLRTLKETISVDNVEDDNTYRTKDIDLIWKYRKGNDEIISYIEVKTDSYTSGNFWLETLSNAMIKTTGCFVKTKADYFYYYFINWDRLYIIPIKDAQSWFVTNLDRFEESHTSTKNPEGGYQHTTVGRKVPIQVMLKEVKDIKIVEGLSKFSSSEQQPQ